MSITMTGSVSVDLIISEPTSLYNPDPRIITCIRLVGLLPQLVEHGDTVSNILGFGGDLSGIGRRENEIPVRGNWYVSNILHLKTVDTTAVSAQLFSVTSPP